MNRLKYFFLLAAWALLGNIKAQTITITQLQQACNNDGIIVANTTGMTPPIIFTWYSGGIQVIDTVNATSDTLFNYSGDYAYCTSTCFGCGGPTTSFYSPPFTYTISTTDPVCPATMGSGTVSISGGQTPFTIEWHDLMTGNLYTTGSPATLPVGSFSVHVVDGNGCVVDKSDSLYIWQQSPLTSTATSTPANCTNGSASITNVAGGVAPYTYVWSNGQTGTQITNLTGNTYYFCTITDAQGCHCWQNVQVVQTVTITPNIVPTNATCLQNDGSAITFGSGGVSPYTYLYSNGQTTQTASGLLAGSYDVYVTDANGCIGYDWFYISATTPITVTSTTSVSSCTSPTGSATLTISGGQTPYTVNWSSSPPQSGPVLNAVSGGMYQFYITDANGCVNNAYVYVPPVSQMYAAPWATPAMCPSGNGVAGMSAWTNNPPLTYSWSTGATTSSISNVAVGSYACTITDAVGCQLHKTAIVGQTSPVNLGWSVNDASCIFTSDGSISLFPTGGTAPYTYYCNGQTTQTISNLATGWYWVTATDANGCSDHKYVYVGYNAANNTCYCTVTGTVYYDANGNCVRDPGETPVEHMMIKDNNTITSYPISNYAFSDTGGVYTFILPTGSYNIQEVIQYMYPPSSCQSNNNPLNLTASAGCTYTIDFANGINPLHDLHVWNLHLNLPVPGNNYTQQVVVQNDGTVTEANIPVGYGHDGQMLLQNISGIPLSQPNAGLAPNWYDDASTTLNPGQGIATNITYAVPTNIPLGTQVNFWDSTAYAPAMSNWLNDYTPWNNVKAFDTVVVGSFDPNMKEVSPKGVGPLGLIAPSDSVLDYVIHFQNTGSWQAAKVVVIDTLDADLEWETLKPGYSNRNYTASVDNHGVLSFTFNNINLVPEWMSESGSIGVISYSIHTKKNLPMGTQFINSAAIFFDYNQPIITNTTLNTLGVAGINEVKSADGTMKLFPNPANESCTIKLNTDQEATAQISLYSTNGALVKVIDEHVQKGENTLSFNVWGLPTGLYIVRLGYGNHMHYCKLSVVK